MRKFICTTFVLTLAFALQAEPIDSVLATEGCELEEEAWCPTASDYVMDGLFRQLDAIETTGFGEEVHEAGTKLVNLASGIRSNVQLGSNATWDGENLTMLKNFPNQVFDYTDTRPRLTQAFENDTWTLEFCGWLSQAVGQYDNSAANYKWGLCGIRTGKKNQLVFSGGNNEVIVAFNALEFHTLSLVRDGDFCFCYIDGRLVKSFATNVSGIVPRLFNFYLYIDTVLCSYRFYDEALSSEEVQYNSIVDRRRFGF